MATIYDVAERAGVSISTVSLALNAPDRVRDTTLLRIMDAVDQLGFLPKVEAVTRARRGVRRVAVLAPFSAYPSFARRLNGVLRVSARERFEVVVYDQESAATSRLVSLPLTGRVDGLIVMSLPFGDDVAQRLAEQRLPTVLVDNARAGFSSVTTDDAAGGRMVAELLIRRGHERFGFLGHAQRTHDYLSQSEARLDGFRAALPSPPQTRLVDHAFEAARAGAHALLRASQRPTAIFAHDDLLASGVLRAARDLGLAVPTELAVVGFDDAEIAEPLGLTSVRQPLEESGEIATQILLDQLKDARRSSQHTTLALKVVERDSTAT
jgi:LacI family transcriptional regulator, repressor for deo operon, udp, cdd, tsx, nupC, and nupG